MQTCAYPRDVCSTLKELWSNTMKRIITAFSLVLALVGGAHAAGAGFPLEKAPNRTNDMAALQNGAKLFTNYCLSCNSAAFMRYNRMRDIGLTEKQIKENLMFTTCLLYTSRCV